MELSEVAKFVAAIGTPLATLVGVGGRKRRLRNAIRENLELLEKLGEDEVIRDHTLARAWLQGRVTLDVARLAGQPLGAPKKPVQKGSVALATVLALGFGSWTWFIARDGFVWYSVFPGTVAFLFVISVFGMTTNRELPTDEAESLPAGATPVQADSAQDEIAAAVHFAATGDDPGRFAEGGAAWTALQFVERARTQDYASTVMLAEDNWCLCRVQSWVWNNRESLEDGTGDLTALAADLAEKRSSHPLWAEFAASESDQFAKAWGPFAPDAVGAASKRRRVSGDSEAVIIAPLSGAGRNGYFVTQPTLVQGAVTLLMRRTGGRWLLASHLALAPPQPGMPPIWWNTGDPAIDALPEPT